MLLRILLVCIFFFNFYLNGNTSEKQYIIDRLLEINNFSFSFEQVTKEKVETGNCILEFDRKLRCNYDDKLQKEIIINNKTLVILHKRYDKIYFYPISKSVFLNILSKDKLIILIKESDLILNENIELVYFDKNQKLIRIFFNKKDFELIGWAIEDEFQNNINFSLKIDNINNNINKNYFKIPTLN